MLTILTMMYLLYLLCLLYLLHLLHLPCLPHLLYLLLLILTVLTTLTMGGRHRRRKVSRQVGKLQLQKEPQERDSDLQLGEQGAQLRRDRSTAWLLDDIVMSRNKPVWTSLRLLYDEHFTTGGLHGC